MRSRRQRRVAVVEGRRWLVVFGVPVVVVRLSGVEGVAVGVASGVTGGVVEVSFAVSEA